MGNTGKIRPPVPTTAPVATTRHTAKRGKNKGGYTMSIQYDSISYAAYVKDGKVTYEAIYQDAGRIVYTLTITEREYVNIITGAA